MQSLRRSRTLVRLVLAWFVFTVGAAMAGPVLKPQTFQLVCSSSGAIAVVALSDEGQAHTSSHGLDCPLCAQTGAPPPAAPAAIAAPQPLGYALRPAVAAHIAWLTTPPLPARGPPSLT